MPKILNLIFFSKKLFSHFKMTAWSKKCLNFPLKETKIISYLRNWNKLKYCTQNQNKFSILFLKTIPLSFDLKKI